MALLREDYEAMSTLELEAIVKADFEGVNVLPVETMLDILFVLVERSEIKYDVQQKFREFCEEYLDA